MQPVEDQDAARYLRWLKAVNTCLHEKLGGDEPTDENGLRFGEGRFQFDVVNEMGEVQYRIDLPNRPSSTATTGGPFQWRAFRPDDVCAELINVYEQLRRDNAPD